MLTMTFKTTFEGLEKRPGALWRVPLLALAWIMVLAPLAGAEVLSETQIKKLPGYVDFGDLMGQYSDGDQEVEIQLTQPLLGIMAPLVRGDDPELADLVLDLHLVKVNNFSFRSADEAAIRDKMEDMAKELRQKKWDNIVKVRDQDERVNVFVHLEGNGEDPSNTFLSGLAVLVFEQDEATLVNVVGRFRLEDIAKIGRQFDIPQIEDLQREQRRHRRSGKGEGKSEVEGESNGSGRF